MTSSALLLWVVGALAGSMIFFGAVVAPLVFRVLPVDVAGTFLRAFFPHYYLWGLVVALIATVVGAFVGPTSLVLCLLVVALFLYVRQSLMPMINRARDASLAGDAAAKDRFERLHHASVAINLTQLVILLMVAARLVW